MIDKSEEVNNLKERGNSSLKEEKYEEAVLYYTHAIKIDDKNHSLFSNRSLAFLKMSQFYFALEDAKEAIKLKPDWAKGYYRKGEVEFNTFNFNEALFSYTHALMLQPKEPVVENAIKRTMEAMKQDETADSQVSWIGAAIGIFIGASIVVADQILTHKPAIVKSKKKKTLKKFNMLFDRTYRDPISMVLLTVAIAIIGYGAARCFRYYIKHQRMGLLEPPVDLVIEQDKKKEGVHKEDVKESRIRYSKAQARQRYKKGFLQRI